MKGKNTWINFSIAGLCMVGLLGLLLRSKFVFELSFINYNHLVEAHSRFTFNGWVALILMVLMLDELLPVSANNKKIYQWLLGGITILSWLILIVFVLAGYNTISIILSTLFIILTYIFSFVFIKDINKTQLTAFVRWLATAALVSLVLSSSGLFIIAYIYITNSFEAFLYRDALFTYLHFQYNGFFSFSILALLFHSISNQVSEVIREKMRRFSIFLLISLLPSLFISYLWQDPKPFYRILAIMGSICVMISFILFMGVIQSIKYLFKKENKWIRLLLWISLFSFSLKLFLQCFTIFPVMGNAIFGNRPIIMGFLHLVFLGFVTLFVLAWLTKKEALAYHQTITRVALVIFASGVLINEFLLISQGLITMFIPASNIIPWLLWAAGIWLFLSAVLIAIARKLSIK